MRITGGTGRGRKLTSPKTGKKSIRPTSDRVREALFSILAAKVVDAAVLDLYAGTGSLGIEALSRGAQQAVFVDQSRQSLTLIHDNLCRCFDAPQASLLQLNLARPDCLQRLTKKLPPLFLFDLVFLDPPYKKKLAESSLQMLDRAGLVKNMGLIIVEEHQGESLPKQLANLNLIDQRRYGETGIWMYQKSEDRIQKIQRAE